MSKNHILPITHKLTKHLKEEGFDGFAPNTHLVAMPHFLPDVTDWISAAIEMGLKPQNIHLLAKQYSQVDATRDKLVAMGIDVIDYTPAPAGKYYETLQGADLPRFWYHSTEKINASLEKEGPQTVLVMDDGGRVIRSLPEKLLNNPDVKMIGVEQTTNGFDVVRHEGHEVDVVIPAMSALKLEFEPPFIAEAAVRKLREKLGMFRNRDISVVGIGKIGGALSEIMANNQNQVFVYDRDVQIDGSGQLIDPNHLVPSRISVYEAPKNGEPLSSAKMVRESTPPGGPRYYICSDLTEAVQSSNYVFGCTGKDIFHDVDFDNFKFQGTNKAIDETRFISLSSGDKEFKSLLTWVAKQPDFLHHGSAPKAGSRWDVTLNHNGSRLRIAQQGFPINFDGKTGSGTPEEMQLVSGFLLASIVQGYKYLEKYPVKSKDDQKNLLMLSPEMQRFILVNWLDGVRGVKDLFKPERVEEIRTSPTWFELYSHGQFCPVFNSDSPHPVCEANKVKSTASVNTTIAMGAG